MASNARLVRYIGIADIRRITDADWRAIGVKGQESVQWDKDTTVPFAISGRHLTSDAVKYLNEDPDFVVIAEDEPE